MLMAPACKKNRVEPILPEPEHYNVVIDWNWKDDLGLAPPVDTIRKYANKHYIDTIFINLTSPNSSGYVPAAFHQARDSLQKDIDIAPQKVWGKGTIYVSPTDGAQLPDPAAFDCCGMALVDSIWFTSRGWAVQRYQHIK